MKTFAAASPARRHQKGISLFEMLMSIAILGVMCSMALPLFGAQHDVFSAVRAKRNAQELVTECTVARAAGVQFVVAGDLEATVANLKAGARATTGAFAGRAFGIKALSTEDLKMATAYLKLQKDDLMVR